MDSEVSSGPTTNGGELWNSRAISAMIFRLGELRTAMLDVESAFEVALRQIPPERLASARNLLHYVALRRHDIRPLQEELLQRGLSSLGRCESHVLANVDAVRALDNILRRMQVHQVKKRPMLRKLRLAENVFPLRSESPGSPQSPKD